MNTNPILGFQGEYRWLSNFYLSPFTMEGFTFPTVEHAYQASKDPRSEWIRYILSKETPGEAKRVGRTATLQPDWDEKKLIFMEILLEAKFSIPKFTHLLVQTGDREIVEVNHWHDTFWGVSAHTNQGENHLGKLIMKIRNNL